MKKLIKKLIRESLVTEYIGRDVLSLKQYLSMSDEQKKAYLPHEYYYKFDVFASENDIDIPFDGESYEIADYLEKEHPEVYKEFSEWLFNKIENHDLEIADSEYPAWSFFGKPEIIKNQWLIHFTDDADSIAQDGFKYGVDEMDKLGLTTHLGEFEKKYGGYNFAYTLSDYPKYARANSWTFKYGKEAVIFNASGIRMWHYSDQEPQVVFYGNTAKHIIPITDGENANYAVRSAKTGRILYEAEKIDNVVNWVVKNYNQYRKEFN